MRVAAAGVTVPWQTDVSLLHPQTWEIHGDGGIATAHKTWQCITTHGKFTVMVEWPWHTRQGTTIVVLVHHNTGRWDWGLAAAAWHKGGSRSHLAPICSPISMAGRGMFLWNFSPARSKKAEEVYRTAMMNERVCVHTCVWTSPTSQQGARSKKAEEG
jgi:hypothetical protein